MDNLQEIESRLSIVDVLREYVSLVPSSGQNNYKCVCPFHDDKDPSMLINENKGIAYCFVCNSGGGMFKFVQQIEGCSFPEAIKILAEKAGVKLQNHRAPSPQKQAENEQIYNCLTATNNFFIQQYNTSEKAQQAMREREYDQSFEQRWQVGYAPPSGDALQKHLLEQGYSRKDMLTAGVIVPIEGQKDQYKDKFRERLIFPIWNSRGQVVAFSGRYLGDFAGAPKYLNSPQTSVYDKSNTLYGYHLAKDAMRQQGFVVLVEGFFDVLALQKAGFANVVATCGTAFTKQHAKLLQRSTKELAFCLDSDDAGQAATRKSIALCAEHGIKNSIINVPGGKDPDDAVREDLQIVTQAVEQRQPGLSEAFKRSFLHRDAAQLDDKQAIMSELAPIIHALPSALEKDHYVNLLADKLSIGKEVIQQELKRTQQITRAGGEKHQQKAISETSLEHLITLLLTWPEAVKHAVAHCDPNHLPESQAQKLYKIIFDAYNAAEVFAPEQLLAQLEKSDQDHWQQQSMLLLEKTAQLPAADHARLTTEAARHAQRDGARQKLEQIKQQQLLDTENLTLAQQAMTLTQVLNKVDTQ